MSIRGFNRNKSLSRITGNVEKNTISATGGTINDYDVSGTKYRAHIFSGSGTLEVTTSTSGVDYKRSKVIRTIQSTANGVVDYLVVGGGGGGTAYPGPRSAGSGAGGFRSFTNQPVSAINYVITVGAGGNASNGTPTVAFGQTAAGGGAGGYNDPFPTGRGSDGGSGGGRWYISAPSTEVGQGNSPPTSPPQGNPGGLAGSTNAWWGGGGGGAGGVGTIGTGGPGAPNVYGFGPALPITFATGGTGNFYATADYSKVGLKNTGDGGSGSFQGGDGAVIVRYVLSPSLVGATAEKATGGAISYYNGKTIHTFLSSGAFVNNTGAPLTVEYVVVGGGGGGASDTGGGGGAGGFRTATGFVVAPGSTPVTIGAGGAASAATPLSNRASVGGDTIFSTITSNGGGGGGGSGGPTQGPGGASPGNGSGGGGGGYNPSAPNTGGAGGAYGNAGGTGTGSGYYGGGGGGSGSAGSNAGPAPGGYGSQAPPTFRNAAAQIFRVGGEDGTYGLGTAPTPGGHWFAGGGGGSQGDNPTGGNGGSGGGGAFARDGLTNTGGGGGGGPGSGGRGRSGGSGIVLIAYPS